MKLTPTIRRFIKLAAALGLALPIAQVQAQDAPEAGDIELIAYWDFENTAEDAENGYTGYLGGDATYSDGEKFGFALDTSALGGSFFRIQLEDELEEGNPISPEFFDHYHATVSERDQVTYTFWQRNTQEELLNQVAFWTVSAESGGSQRGAQGHTPWSNDQIYFDTAGCCDAATQRINAESGIEDWTAWNHFAFVKNGAAKQIWVNGEILLEGESTDPLPADMIAHYIGNGVEESRDQPGLIDEFAIIAGAASEEQIKELASGSEIPSIFDNSNPGLNLNAGKSLSAGTLPGLTTAQEIRFKIKNTVKPGDERGPQPLNISAFEITGGDIDNFTLVSAPTILEPGTTEDLVFSFDNKGAFGPFTLELNVKSDDGDADDQDINVTVRATVFNPKGPRAHIRLDETTGDVAADSTGGNRNGTYEGGALGQPGLTADSATAVTFTGGTHVAIPDSAFSTLPSFTVSLWANAASNGDAGAADFRTLVGKGEANPAFGLLEAGGELLWFREEGVAFSTAGAAITPGETYHLVMRLDGETNTGTIYVNGEAIASETVEPVDDAGGFFIGAFRGALGFEGTIDDVQVYDFAISDEAAGDEQDEVAFLMNNPGVVLTPVGEADSDSDGLTDGEEINTHSTDPFNPDSDGDNLSDGQEVALGTDPNNEDTDGDRFKDGLEIERGTDPLVADERGGGQVTIEILGTGVEALLGGDLTDPENDGLDAVGAAMDPSWNWVNITGNIEADFEDGEAAFNIFDNQVGGGGAKWCCDDPSPDNPYWVSVEFADAISLTHFTITNGNDTPDRDPTNWQIQGSNDGENFETIFAEEAESIWSETRNEVALVTLASPSAPYRHIRYIVFDTPGALHQLNEIEYFGNVATSLLVNGSFEEPTVDNVNMNNLGVVPTGWSQTGDDATWNVIKNDGSAYDNGVDNAADGSQIVDLNGIFEIFQTFTLDSASNVNFGASFGNRAGFEGDPSTIGIYDASGENLVSSLVTVDTSGDPQPSEAWASGSGSVTLAAGDYQIRIALNNWNNVDAVFATATPPGGSTLGNGLIAYYPLDGDFDDNAGDAHGEEQGTAPIEFAEGAFGQGVDLDGVDQFIITPVEVEDRFDFSDGTGFSVSAWFRVDAFDKSWQALVTKGEGTNWRIHRQGETNNLGPVAGGVNPDNGNGFDLVENPVDINDGNIHHVVITNIPDAGTYLYIDGVLNQEGFPGVPEGNEWPMMIGENANNGGNGRTWNGLIDDVAVWNRGLSDDEVSQIFNGPSIGEQIAGGGAGGGPALIAHFPLDADGNSAGGGFTASTTTDVTFDGTGANANTGTSAVFNGSSSLIQHDWSADLNPESFTLALWAKSDGGAGAWNSPVTSRHDLNTEGEASQGYLIYDNEPAGAWTFWSGNGTVAGNWQVLDGPAVTIGEWEHVAISYDHATETKRLYINGVLAVEANDSITPNDTTPFNIGAGEDTGTGFHFVGEIDDIGLWNAELTVEQIQAAMNNGVQAALSGSVGGVDGVDVPNIGPVIAGPDSVGLSFTGLAGKTYDIEYSADLVTWTVVMSGLTGDVSFEDSDAARLGLASGFYRGVQN